jgi:hypothetical protein
VTFDFQVNDRRRNPDRRKNCLTPEQLESRLLLSISSVSSSSLPIVSNLAAGLPVVVSKNATVTATLDATDTFNVTGTTTVIAVRALEQFANPMLTLPSIAWSTILAPTGGSASIKVTGGLAELEAMLLDLIYCELNALYNV